MRHTAAHAAGAPSSGAGNLALSEPLTASPARPMHLAFVADPDSVHTRRWIAWFAAAGHRVTVADPVGIELASPLPGGVVIARATPGRRPPLVGPLADGRALRRLLDELRPDVVHAQYLARFGWAAAASGYRPLVVTPWGSDLLQVRPRQVRTRLWNALALRRADLVTVSSEGMRRAAMDAGARGGRIALVHHGVDTTRFAPGTPDPTLVTRVRPEGRPVIVSPRAVRPLYRHDVVIEAVARVAGGGRGAAAPVLVLSAMGADPATLRAVRERGEALGLGDHLRVLDGLAHEELPHLYRLADVVVSVPETDSFPVTLLEAMACGVPVVTSDVPAVGPVMRSLGGAAGALVVPVGDTEATASALERALRMAPDGRHALGGALRQHVVENAEYGTNMARMERLYHRLARHRRG